MRSIWIDPRCPGTCRYLKRQMQILWHERRQMVPSGGDSFRIAGQVSSGIGFLAAGLLLRNGLNITGLNTAPTLWCSAAIDVEHTDEVEAQAVPTSTGRQSSSRL